MTNRRSGLAGRCGLVAGLLALVGTAAAGAVAQPVAGPVMKKVQPGEKAPAKPAPKPSSEEKPAQPPAEKPRPNDLPSLDELLGLSGQKPADAGDPSRRDLDRLLTGAEVGDAFKEAAALMGDAADRLQASRDAGLVTQRVQDDIVKRLDQLISSLENMQRQSSSSSSSAQQQSQTQQNVPNQQNRGQRQQNTGDNRGETQPPARQDGPLRPGMEAARAEWGRLPERVRDMLVQGSGEHWSELYKQLTSQYYRKLAEQGKAKP